MCPPGLLLTLLIIIVIAVVIYQWRQMSQEAYRDALNVAEHLKQPIIRKFVSVTVEGYYQGRKVKFDHYVNNEGCIRTFRLEPKIAKPQPFSLFKHPKPTPNTQLKGNQIYFIKPDRYHIKDVLMELTQAAEIVEAGI